MTHWHDTLVIANHRLNQSLSSRVDANISQMSPTTNVTNTHACQVLLRVSLKSRFKTHSAAVRI
jgi:hypothetical protein